MSEQKLTKAEKEEIKQTKLVAKLLAQHQEKEVKFQIRMTTAERAKLKMLAAHRETTMEKVALECLRKELNKLQDIPALESLWAPPETETSAEIETIVDEVRARGFTRDANGMVIVTNAAAFDPTNLTQDGENVEEYEQRIQKMVQRNMAEFPVEVDIDEVPD